MFYLFNFSPITVVYYITILRHYNIVDYSLYSSNTIQNEEHTGDLQNTPNGFIF